MHHVTYSSLLFKKSYYTMAHVVSEFPIKGWSLHPALEGGVLVTGLEVPVVSLPLVCPKECSV